PEAAGFHANLGEALRVLRRSEEAAGHIRRALELDPAQPDAWNTRGLLAHDRGRYDEAAAAYREAIRLRPRFAAAFISLGEALRGSGHPRAAAETLRAALGPEPDNALALTNLGKVLIEMEDPDRLDEAETLCRRAVARAPRLSQAVNNLGNVLRLQGRF